ncbi:hypothetical protein [Massilia niabensis]|uniref:Curlin n=1 Tax=Massilia niabensis TaxID=544910 RepID=A0ABW0L291_9BURK
MKHITFVIASACCLSAAAPALANDTAKIAQGGTGNTVMIEQIATAGNNHASVRQGEGWYSGSGNHAQLTQRGVDNSRIDVVQSGFNNQHMVHQFDGTNLQANVNVNSGQYGNGGGEGNMVDIRQSGSNAHAWVEQSTSMYGRAEIWQSGWGGSTYADINQSGHANQARIEQMGGDNQASVYQSGSNLNASIIQNSSGYHGGGYGNNATIRQGF